VLTDGLTEVFDKADREFGLPGVKEAFARHANQPLESILSSVVTAARRHGPQQDDQTALILRFTQ
jgi:serine phosphatase RsbU (regulator of sigma subunit)